MMFFIRLIVAILVLVTSPVWAFASIIAWIGFGWDENPFTIVHKWLGIK